MGSQGSGGEATPGCSVLICTTNFGGVDLSRLIGVAATLPGVSVEVSPSTVAAQLHHQVLLDTVQGYLRSPFAIHEN